MNTNHPKIGAYNPESDVTTPKIGFLYVYSKIDPVAAISTMTLKSKYAGQGNPPFASAAARSISRRSQIGISSSFAVDAAPEAVDASSSCSAALTMMHSRRDADATRDTRAGAVRRADRVVVVVFVVVAVMRTCVAVNMIGYSRVVRLVREGCFSFGY